METNHHTGNHIALGKFCEFTSFWLFKCSVCSILVNNPLVISEYYKFHFSTNNSHILLILGTEIMKLSLRIDLSYELKIAEKMLLFFTVYSIITNFMYTYILSARFHIFIRVCLIFDHMLLPLHILGLVSQGVVVPMFTSPLHFHTNKQVRLFYSQNDNICKANKKFEY